MIPEILKKLDEHKKRLKNGKSSFLVEKLEKIQQAILKDPKILKDNNNDSLR